MRAPFILLLSLFALTVLAFAPERAYATGRYFGGVVVSSLPCVNLPGAFVVFTRPLATTFVTPLIYTPVYTPPTLANLAPPIPAVPPLVPGSQIAGISDIPLLCMVGKIPFPGWRMQTVRGGLIPLNPAAFFGV